MWAGSLTIWAIPAVFWPLTFAGVKILNVIYSAWLQYVISNFTPLHYLATTIMLVVAYTNLTEKADSLGVKGVTIHEVMITLAAWSSAAFVNWLIVLFLGKDAIMYIDYTLFEDPEKWEDPGYLVPSMFG